MFYLVVEFHFCKLYKCYNISTPICFGEYIHIGELFRSEKFQTITISQLYLGMIEAVENL